MMQHSDLESAAEERLRKALDDAAPRPSTAHDETILRAARAKAQATAKDIAKPRRSRTMPAFGIAATFILAIAVAWLLRIETPDDTYVRSGTAANVIPADGVLLKEAPSRFVWPASGQAERYRLSVYNDAADLIWASPPTTETEWLVGDELQLPANARYFWVVDLLDSAQRPTIGPFWFTLE